MERKRVGILLFTDIEILDFCGPFEVFAAVRLEEEKRRETASPFEVVTVSEKGGVVRTAGGLRVISEHSFADAPELQILVVPGGWGVRKEIDNEALIAWLRERGKRAEILCSVCTGAMLIGHAGLLEGLRATTHWRSLDWMRGAFPRVRVEDDLHVVEDGNVITSAGISAGIDLALRVVARLHGDEIARATARHMEYRYPDDNSRRV
jgi:transcriptional regulator GlxA family with amidase domain